MKKFFGVLIKSILFISAWIALLVIEIPSDRPEIWRFFAELTPLLGIIVISVIFWLVEKRNIKIFPCKNILKSSLIGIGFSIFWLGATVGIMYLTGTISFVGINQVPYLWLWILSAFLNVIMQELLARGYLYQLVKKNYGIVASTIFTTVLFTAAHAGAFEAGIIAVLNVVTMSLFVTALLEYTDSLVAPILAHSFWNIVGSIILGGVSLADDYPHLLNIKFFGNALLSGGEYKIEGSIVVLGINVLLCAIVVALIVKRKRKAQ